MSKVTLIIFTLLLVVSDAESQHFGYQGRKFELGFELENTLKPHIYRAISLKSEEFSQGLFRIPINLGVSCHLAVNRRIGLGVNAWMGKNFISYHNKEVREGASFDRLVGFSSNNLLFDLDLYEEYEEKIYEFSINQSLTTYYLGGELRTYHGSGIAPASDYFVFGLGSIGVTENSQSEYIMILDEELLEIMENNQVELPEGIILENDRLRISPPEIDPIMFLTIGMNRRYKILKERPLLLDAGFKTMWRLFAGNKVEPDGIDSSGPGVLGRGESVKAYQLEKIPDAIRANTYTWIVKQNFIKLNLRVSYLF